ncbi:DUF2971 domain-containing protein [Brucella sp. 10RB9212]|uniref:DUF2971 domain-containing protein n=1 Tax=unclassified Brucella TaxID=2632610 RepID=UPI0009727F28|nr:MULTISPECIES: DUF2971 domain-containing protein [unclassified Brucella]APY15763.1 hypothetical protein BKD02_15970 [Brucella sp. 09RB8910]MRN45395.1 DUF2971 domain-containing protein [Brucella sp. 10RB9212]
MGIAILNDLAPSTRIYRMMRVEHLEDMFHSRHNSLIRPSKWIDKSDGNLLKVGFEDEQYAINELDKMVYAQCWTTEYSSALMWQAYANNPKDFVRIRTTVGKLQASMNDADKNPNFYPFRAFIGAVEYIDRRKAEKYQRDISQQHTEWELLAKSFLVKSDFFQGENEVRLICFVQDHDYTNECDIDIFPYSVNPHNLVEAIHLPPNLTHIEFEQYRRMIVKLISVDEKIVKRSTIYDPWELQSIKVQKIPSLS